MKYLISVLCLYLAGCVTNESLKQDLIKQSSPNGFIEATWPASIPIFTLIKAGKSDTLNVYIEGDGQSFLTRYEPSRDPTPEKATGAQLAMADQSNHTIVYMARPCQFIKTQQCTTQDWTSGRFSSDFIHIYNTILNQFKKQYNATHINLHGYSGGAYIALLIAEKRNDIQCITTFAGLLDHQKWTSNYDFSPLTHSAIIKDINHLKAIRQVHYVGELDSTIPITLTQQFLKSISSPNATLHIVPHMTHDGDWASFWRQQQS